MVRSNSAADRAYIAIHDMILSREFDAGEPMSEYRLSEVLSLSRTPVREALKRLELRGLLENLPGRGMFVRRYTVKDVIELSEARREIECVAIRKMAMAPNQEDVDAMRAIATEAQKAIDAGDVDSSVDIGDRFHAIIRNRLDNSRLGQLLDEVREQSMYLSRIEVQTGRGAEIAGTAASDHFEIADLLEKGDVAGADGLMRRHLTTHENELLSLASAGVI